MVFCEFCGASLIGQKPLDTKSLDSGDETVQKEYGVDVEALTDVRVQGTSTFQEGDRLRLEIEGSPEPVFFSIKEEVVFGRKDPATGAMPDIDLTPFAGYRMGVSRRHAAISLSAEHGLDVRDLGSSNGTFLNGQQLAAHRLYRLRNGDELRLGQMVIRVLFEPTKAAQPTPAQSEASAPPAVETPAKTLSTQRSSQPAVGTEAASGESAQKAPAAPEAQAEAKSEAAAPNAPPTSTEAAESGKAQAAEAQPKPETKPEAKPSVAAPSPAPDASAEPETPPKTSPDKPETLPKTSPDKPESSEQDKRD